MFAVLNVAEKPSVAREIVKHLGARVKQVQSYSKYNPVAQFEFQFRNSKCLMLVTSVAGHLMDLSFPPIYKNWNSVNPAVLFAAPVIKAVKPDCGDIEKNLKQYARNSSVLVLWLDCDREGENIAYEVVEVCHQSNPRLEILRARFSALTKTDIDRAWNTLTLPNRALSEAVDCRQELDLRIGATITRFLTLRYKQKFNIPSKVISFGPCQFPTLGFVVERYLQRLSFRSEDFWKLQLIVNLSCGKSVELMWMRGRLFDEAVVMLYKQWCEMAGVAKAVKVDARKVTKRKPLPLTTTQLAILSSKKLRISSKLCMQIAESLYQKGFISYPRTETNRFSPSIDLKKMISIHHQHPQWGSYAASLTDGGRFRRPVNGNSDDAAHPPIHPVKSCNRSNFQNENEWKIYNLVTRHFLACCSDDAIGEKTTVTLEMNGELFCCSGLVVKEKNYLEIYPFDFWGDRQLGRFTAGDLFYNPQLKVIKGTTEAPSLLTEAELIKKMDVNGIGTDATMHEHIQTIQDRCYASVEADSAVFIPTALGVGLVKGFSKYAKDWVDLSKPKLRASVEADLSKIAIGERLKDEVLQDTINQMKRIYSNLSEDPLKLDLSMIQSLSSCVNNNNNSRINNPNSSSHSSSNSSRVAVVNDDDHSHQIPTNSNSSNIPINYCNALINPQSSASGPPLSNSTAPSLLQQSRSMSGPSLPVLPSLLTNIVSRNFSRCRCGGTLSVATPQSLSLTLPDGRSSSRTSRRGGRRTKQESKTPKQRKTRSTQRKQADQQQVQDGQQEQKDRYLVCQLRDVNNCPILPLPKGNVNIAPHDFFCPACRYQIMKVDNKKNTGYHFVCPFCFSCAPPSQFKPDSSNSSSNSSSSSSSSSSNRSIDIEDGWNVNNQQQQQQFQQQLRCFLCSHQTCRIANSNRR